MVGFERFKNYLDEKVETHFAKLRICETQKLSRIAKAEKLKFAGNKGQFIFLTLNFPEPLAKLAIYIC